MFKKILIAVDLDEKQFHDKMIETALKMGGEETVYQLLTIIPPLGGSMVASFLPAGYEKKFIQKAQEGLHAFSEKHLPNQKVKHIVMLGTIYESILQTAEHEHSDLMILSAGNQENLGPNVARVLRYGKKTAVVVR